MDAIPICLRLLRPKALAAEGSEETISQPVALGYPPLTATDVMLTQRKTLFEQF